MGDDLKHLYQDIEATPDETALYRAKLGRTLLEREEASSPPWWSWGLLGGAAVAAVLLFFLLSPSQFDQQTIEEIDNLVAQTTNIERLKSKANHAIKYGDDLNRWNARMVINQTAQTPIVALEAARDGLAQDPRPDFRFRYLEFMLDEADEQPYDLAIIEAAMAEETDPACIELFEDLLKLARRIENS